MLKKAFKEIDRFYFFVIFVLFVLGLLVFMSIRTVYVSYRSVQNPDETVEQEVGLDLDKLNQAYDFLRQKQSLPLDL